jgi:hypothetical protein
MTLRDMPYAVAITVRKVLAFWATWIELSKVGEGSQR